MRYLFILQKEGEREGGPNRQILTQIEREIAKGRERGREREMLT